MRGFLPLGLILLLSVVCVGEEWPLAPVRIWTDASEKYEVEALVVKIEEDQITLRKNPWAAGPDSGELITLPLSKLSEKSQKYAANWMRLSVDAQISIIVEDYEKREKAKLRALKKQWEERPKTEKFDADVWHALKWKEFSETNKVEGFPVDEWVTSDLERRIKLCLENKEVGEEERKKYAAKWEGVLERWKNGILEKEDESQVCPVVARNLAKAGEKIERLSGAEKRKLKAALQQSESFLAELDRRVAHVMKEEDSPYVETRWGLYTRAELEKMEEDAATAAKRKEEIAALMRVRGTARAAADLWVQKYLDNGTIQSAVYLGEDAVRLSPRARVPGNVMGSNLRKVFYRVTYVSNAGVQMQKDDGLILLRAKEGYWGVYNDFSFIQPRTWSPSGSDLERAFGRR